MIMGAATVYWLLHRLRRVTAVLTAQRNATMIGNRILELAGDGILVADLAQQGLPLTYVNAAFERMTGYAAAEAIGKNCRYLQGGDRQQAEITTLRHAIANNHEAHVTLRNYRKDGSMFWNDLRLAPVFDERGRATHCVALMRDVSEQREAAIHLDRAQRLDPLTELDNRQSFYARLDYLLSQAGMSSVLVAKINISGFHAINISFGYDVGDALLREVAARLRGRSDALAARFSADEFGWAVGISEPAHAEAAVSELRRTLAPRFVLPGASVEVRFAIGFVSAAAGDRALSLIRKAGAALHDARSSRLNATCRFEAASETAIRSRTMLAAELQQAVAGSDFILYVQPKVALATGTLLGGEALVRWRHPVFGLQPPDRFIALAEQTGMILDIGALALRGTALLAARINAGRSVPLTFAVNVSPAQFTDRDLVSLLRRVLDESGADPSWLVLELTEGLFVDGSPELIARLRLLREIGVGLAVDDFGTGYSNLGYLDRFPLSQIKIDRSFIAGLHESRFKRVVVDAVVKIGAELGAEVVAEGVESTDERDALLRLGCPNAQGFLFGRPMPSEDFVSFAAQAVVATR